MNIALITTTINVPTVLRTYRECDPEVAIVIAGDLQAPHDEIEALCEEIGYAEYLSPRAQGERWRDLSEVIGWHCVQRRNIAILEALKHEPDVIVTIDDDNIPLDAYFAHIRKAFSEPRTNTVATGEWFNIGELATEPFTYRGFPYSVEPKATVMGLNGERPSRQRIGVLNGLIFGDPDINATERLERGPVVTDYTLEARRGVAVNPRTTMTPVNSQNTAWDADLAPLMLLPPRIGRYDDIWGSYIALKVMSATDYHVLFGQPFVRQERNAHDLFRDLEVELYGMRHTDGLLEVLDAIELSESASVLENLATVRDGLRRLAPNLIPLDFFDAWLEAWQ